MENKNVVYTEEQVTDIKARNKEALEHLTRLRLTPACQIVKENLGNDTFADRLFPYLQDIKFIKQGDKYVEAAIISPWNPANEPAKEA